MASGYKFFTEVFKRTADGRDFIELYAELETAMQLANEQQQRFLDLLCATTDSPHKRAPVPRAGDFSFERASEDGVPTAKRIDPKTLDLQRSSATPVARPLRHTAGAP